MILSHGAVPVIKHRSSLCTSVYPFSSCSKTTASNGLDYKSNPKHTPGQPGNRPNAGIEPKNSLDLFGDSVPSTSKPNQRYTYDADTNTLHRFYNDGNGIWHWSGSTNQGANSINGSQVPNVSR